MRRYLVALALAMVLPLPGLTDVVVKPGETLSEIAERHGVSLTQLMQANGITNPNLVVAGQKLVLPGARRAGSAGSSVTVRPGDTLSTIAEANGVSLTRLMQANGISNPNLVITGQRLVIPGSRNTAAAPPPKPIPTARYTVKIGETLSEIASRFGTSTERLIQINRISNPNLVVAGTQLAIPGRPTPSVAPATRPAQRNTKEHVVRSGENLSTIADNYGVPVERLIAINRIDDPDLVISGTRLKLQAPPPVTAKPTAKPVAQAKPTPKPVAQAKPTAKPVAQAKPTAKLPPKPAATVTPGPKPVAKESSSPAPATTTASSPTKPSPAQPVAQAQPASAVTSTPNTRPSPTPTPAAATTIAATTTAKPPAKAKPVIETKPVAEAKPPAQKALVSVKPAAAKIATATAAPSKVAASKPKGPDWRSYGPLQVDWANWQPMGGSFVAPTLNGEGKPVYLAVNCGARKLNATSQSGQWKSWDSPQTDFEKQLITDICKARSS
ncbi:LysM peptidoglycan-binding domain-containing protein [Synechococcus sp. CBW1108]|uniref:LysM peptidoglycan-binding domain-containing protein n=1 Tax=Synechococcus sp. CBW1108 TaxID=1353147 RepID=UPI0018CD9E2D|nr:LysM peptidoglycan-binding domain-containing protein [Synechococcus sp. CBW1108]QPN69118.1 LysM peptidoglycan-binding domain-containing protein [Synechococcus sp. CBW1108]